MEDRGPIRDHGFDEASSPNYRDLELLGESDNEGRRSHSAPPVLYAYATALLFDSTEPHFAARSTPHTRCT
jgi:hypothetical protein